jgi:hypothetical protein
LGKWTIISSKYDRHAFSQQEIAHANAALIVEEKFVCPDENAMHFCKMKCCCTPNDSCHSG